MLIPRWFADLRIRYKLFLTYSAVLLLAAVVGTVTLDWCVRSAIEDDVEAQLKNSTELVINMVRTAAAASIKNHLRAHAENNRAAVELYYRQYIEGKLSESEAKEAARSFLLGQKIGRTGYVFVWDIRNAPESIILAVHPKIQGQDVSSIAFVQNGVKLKNGYMEYWWQNPGEDHGRDKAMYLAYFEPWQWIVAVSSYREEFLDLIDISDFRASILSVTLGRTGYCCILDSRGNVVVHPTAAGNVYNETDDEGRHIVREMCMKRKGKIDFSWIAPGNSAYRPKLVFFDYIPEYDWIVAATSYKDEFSAPLYAVRFSVILAGGLIMLLVLAISFIIGHFINAPMQDLVDAFESKDAANLTTRLPVTSCDEIGRLAVHFNKFMDNLERESTERKAAEQALRESEERLRAIIDNARGVIWVKDLDGRFLIINRYLEHLIGKPEEQVVGRTVFDVFPQQIAEQFEANDRQVLGSGKPMEFEEFAKLRDGEHTYLSVKFPLSDSSGRIYALCAICTDITERKAAEKALRKSEERFRLIAKTIDEVFWMINAQTGQMIYISPGYERLWGRSRENLYKDPKTFIDAIHAEDRERVLAGLAVRNSGQPFDQEYRITRTDGSVRWIWDRGFPVYNPSGLGTFYVGVAMDITERKLAEEERTRVEAQLIQAQKMESLGTLAGGIAHDFNNILGIIMGYTEIARLRAGEDSQIRKNLDSVIDAADRAKGLVRQILSFSRRGDKGKKPVQVGSIVEDAMKMVRASLPATIQIRVDVASEAVVMSDPTQIHQILMNLCTNSAHAMRDCGGMLDVCLADVHFGHEDIRPHPELEAGKYVELTVRDTGHGIEPAILDRIFDPFFTTKEHGAGTGLGLAVVHGNVKSHGGAVGVESFPGKGAAFRIYLPVVNSAPIVETEKTSPSQGGGERILLVDDEAELAMSTKLMLEYLGYRVDFQTSGIEALEMFRGKMPGECFDLVITDMTMPRITGADLAKELRKVQRDLPIILCTGYSETLKYENTEELGIQGFLQKPFALSELAQAVRDVLHKRGTDGEAFRGSLS